MGLSRKVRLVGSHQLSNCVGRFIVNVVFALLFCMSYLLCFSVWDYHILYSFSVTLQPLRVINLTLIALHALKRLLRERARQLARNGIIYNSS
ncbi:hypothetical protein V1508DRAFT_411822 [Lipomyces doorenjongii]|uniref:uncharacterized protein n=1 Tax=Lipomyces doorenjongii TaxID=383834 RepID=UPI0034CD5F17